MKERTQTKRNKNIIQLLKSENYWFQFLPCNLRKTKDLPLPHRAYIPTVSGMVSEGSHNTSAKALV